MSVFADLVGQRLTVETLTRAVADGQAMTHAWLFTGPPGSGRSTAARAFAAALECPSGGCGQCRECRTAVSYTHLDVYKRQGVDAARNRFCASFSASPTQSSGATSQPNRQPVMP